MQEKTEQKDPHGTNQHTAGAKLDDGKELPFLMEAMTHAMAEAEKCGTYGAKKYSQYGWYQVPDAEKRYLQAYKRHWNKYWRDCEDVDDESGAHHIGACIWNLMAFLELRLGKKNRVLQEAYPDEFTHPEEGD